MIPTTSASKRGREVARFLVVGATSAALNTAIIVALTETFRLHYLVSYAVCFVLVTLYGFAANRSWSFAVKGPVRRQELVRYYVTTIIATVLAMAFSNLMVRAGMAYWLAVFLSAGVIAPLNFVAHRFWSFGAGADQ